jgi:hypothetical protein
LAIDRSVISRRAKSEKWCKKSTEKCTAAITKSNTDLRHNITPHGNSKYQEDYAKQAYKLCLLGATDNELANFFDVSEQTINNWKADHPVFFESLKKGKIAADAQVAESLYNRATGYTCKDTHVSNFQGAITLTELDKHYPPDVVAAIFWLKNRQSDNWRDKPTQSDIGELTSDFMDQLKTTIHERLEQARARNRAVLIERGIIIDG